MRDAFKCHVPSTLDSPLIVLLEQQGADKTNDGVLVGEEADDNGAPLDLAVHTLANWCCAALCGFGVGTTCRPVRPPRRCPSSWLAWGAGSRLVGDLAPLSLAASGISVSRGDEGGHDTAPALAGLRHGVAGEMEPAPLPCRAEHARDSGLDAFVRIRNDELHAAQAAPCQAAQEVGPERLGLQCADRQSQHFAPPVAVHPQRDGDANRDDASGQAHPQARGIDRDVRLVALDGLVEKHLHADVDLLAQPAHLALRVAAHPHGFDQIIHRAGRDPLDVGLCTTAVSAFSARRRGSRNAGK